MPRIRSTRQARKLRPMAHVLAARQRFWKVYHVLLIEKPYNAYDNLVEYGELYGEYLNALYVKQAAEIHYKGDLSKLRGARNGDMR